MVEPFWRRQLVPASFRLAPFHVDVNARQSGRRIVLHEFPKRDMPYAEDMGRATRRFAVTGYVIGSDYIIRRELLVAALEIEGPGPLILPTLMQRDTILVSVRDYTVRETRQAGGMAEFDMQFVESGEMAFGINLDTQGNVGSAADSLESGAVGASGGELGGPGSGPGGGGNDPGGTVEIGEPVIGEPAP